MAGIKEAQDTKAYVEGVVKELDKKINETQKKIDGGESELSLASLRIAKAALVDCRNRLENGALAAMQKALDWAKEDLKEEK